MYEIIQRIIDIDKAARELTQDAIERKANSSAAAEEKKKEVTENYLSMARKRVDIIRSTEVSYAQQQLNEANSRSERISERMQKEYEANREKWVSEIVKRVISGDD